MIWQVTCGIGSYPSRLCDLQIASALLYIHSKKVLHRDLKTQVRVEPVCHARSCTHASLF